MNLANSDCHGCKMRGRIFPDGIKACARHTSPEWRERLEELEKRSKKILRLGWPYGPQIDVQSRIDLLEWAEPLGVKASYSRCQQFHWLRTGQCQHDLCNRLDWMDHTTLWTLEGKPALLLTQPYNTADEQRKLMSDVLDDEDFRVEIKPGWYGYGTIGAFVWRADAHQKLFG